jgi:hypothetical protein
MLIVSVSAELPPEAITPGSSVICAKPHTVKKIVTNTKKTLLLIGMSLLKGHKKEAKSQMFELFLMLRL